MSLRRTIRITTTSFGVVRLILIIIAFCGLLLLLVFLLRALGRGLGGRKSFEKIKGTLF